MSDLRIIYRLSDAGEKKLKLPEIGNAYCLNNFLSHFPAANVTVIADNVTDETFAWLQGLGLAEVVRTALGNSGSFWACYERALALPDETAVYFVENDYLHREGAREVLMEGLEIADFVTLYDHPDKYEDGVNPLVRGGGERTVVRLTKSCHWKYTNSTTMTFAARVSTLRRDARLFRQHTVGLIGLIGGRRIPGLRRWQPKRVPQDFQLFCALARRGRRLASPIPGWSTHGESAWITPFFERLDA